MNTQTPLLWYVLYTKPRWEKKVAELLGKRNILHYCPINKVKKQWHDRKKTVLEPLFTSYVFVYTTSSSHTFIKDVPGVINFVYWLGKPAVVRNTEIEAIKGFLEEHETVLIEKIPVNVSVDDKVTIVHGPLIHKEGRVVQVLNNFVKVELPSIGYSLVAKVNKADIQLQEISSGVTFTN